MPLQVGEPAIGHTRCSPACLFEVLEFDWAVPEFLQQPLKAEAFMRLVSSRVNLIARVFDRVLRVSRTIADLAGDEMVGKPHLAEAVQYREREGG